MKRQWLVTRIASFPDREFTFWLEDGRAVQIHVRTAGEQRLLGNIYIGKIKNIADNIGAAFVEIGEGRLCHVPLAELSRALYTNRTVQGKPRPGDEVLIQVTKEALKTKLPGASGNLSLTGTYLVLTTGKTVLGLSGKLSAKKKAELKEALADLVTGEYGFIVRTNAADAPEEAIRREADLLAEKYRRLLSQARSRTCFSCLLHREENAVADLRDTNLAGLHEIVTDQPAAAQAAEAFLAQQGLAQPPPVRLYTDAYPLAKLYSLERVLEEAQRERVWLKSGGYLVIQPTEALTVIDVNTGKYEGRRKAEETFLKINLEAAREAARQIRLRNLSGILLIDFIDMQKEAHQKELADCLKECLRADPVKAEFVDFTRLGLAELTRKKVRRTLAEQLRADG